MEVCTGLLILAITALFGVWQMPEALRLLAARVMARAEAIEAQRATQKDALERWNQTFGNKQREC